MRERIFRTGLGFDSHPFSKNLSLILGGIEIKDAPRLEGVSDGDALLHALSDALLGAAGRGNIGDYFPPDSPSSRGINSSIILKKSLEVLNSEGWKIENVDAVLICDRLKLKGHIEGMRKKISEILGIDEERISIKPKSSEGTLFLKGSDGIIAFVSVLVSKVL